MELLQKVFNSYQTFAKSSILDTWQGFKYASEIYNHSTYFYNYDYLDQYITICTCYA